MAERIRKFITRVGLPLFTVGALSGAASGCDTGNQGAGNSSADNTGTHQNIDSSNRDPRTSRDGVGPALPRDRDGVGPALPRRDRDGIGPAYPGYESGGDSIGPAFPGYESNAGKIGPRPRVIYPK